MSQYRQQNQLIHKLQKNIQTNWISGSHYDPYYILGRLLCADNAPCFLLDSFFNPEHTPKHQPVSTGLQNITYQNRLLIQHVPTCKQISHCHSSVSEYGYLKFDAMQLFRYISMFWESTLHRHSYISTQIQQHILVKYKHQNNIMYDTHSICVR